jgi:hypothetical protein
MSYASVQAIREGAGLLSHSTNETPSGIIDGTNKDFYSKRRPIVDSDNDDEVTVADARAFVNGVNVEIEEVEPSTGKIRLLVAPSVGNKVTVDYCSSSLTDEYIQGKQQEADSWIDLKLKGKVDKLPLNPVPGIIVTVAELYASGLILTKDWGNRADTQLTSKDGYSKIKTARELLNDYILGIDQDEQNKTPDNAASVITDGDVFSRTVDEEYCDEEDMFMRRKC